MNIIRVLFLSAILGLFLNTACSDNSTSITQEETPAPIEITTITLDNVGATAYTVMEINGEGATATTNAENVDISLKVGNRFVFINQSGAANHPLDFRNSDNAKVFGQGNSTGLFDGNEGVDLVKEGNRISFTLTEELAATIKDYICAFHPGMNGNIIVIN